MMQTAKRLLKYVLERSSPSVYRWIKTQRNIAAVRKGLRLVPEAALEQKYLEALHLLIEIHGIERLGDYLEFGVYNGTSLACMHRTLEQIGAEHVRLFGFDSFAGLPPEAATDDGGHWRPGQFIMDYQFARDFLTEQGVRWDRVFLVKGWFRDTLNAELIKKYTIQKASVIMVDCDMYLSAKTALSFCTTLIKDTAIVLFDDWFAAGGRLIEKNMGEKRAFDEFIASNPQFSVKELGDYGGYSKVFMVSR